MLNPLLHGRRRQLPQQGAWEFSPAGFAACVESDPAELGQPPHSAWPAVPAVTPLGQHGGDPADDEPDPPRPATSEASPTPRAAKITIPEISVLSERRLPEGEPPQQSAPDPFDP